MKYNNPLYGALCSALIAFFPAFGMEEISSFPTFGEKSTIFSPDQPLLFAQPPLTQPQLFGETEDEQNFINNCRLLPIKLNMLKMAINQNKPIDVIEIRTNAVKEGLTKLIDFIQGKDPQPTLHIQNLNAIKSALENEKADDIKESIDSWLKTVEKTCKLTSEQPKKEKISLENWPTTPKEQVAYLNITKWDIPTKTYILQLLWWKSKKSLFAAPQENKQKIIQQMDIFKNALEKIKQTIPTSQTIQLPNEKSEIVPLFTYQLKRIPKDAAPELKEFLLNSLNAEQKEAYEKRIQLETALKSEETVIKNYQTQAQEKKLSLAELPQYNNVLRARQATLQAYLSVLQPHEEKLKETINKSIATVQDRIITVRNQIINKITEENLSQEQKLQRIAESLKDDPMLNEIIRQTQAQQMKTAIFQRIDQNQPLPNFQYTNILTAADIQEIESYLQNKITEKTKFLLELNFFGPSSNASKKKEAAPQILNNIVFLATNIQKADKNNITLIEKFTENPIFQRPNSILELLDEQEQIAFINAGNIISQFFKPTPSLQSVAKQLPPQAQQIQISTPTFIPISVAQQPLTQTFTRPQVPIYQQQPVFIPTTQQQAPVQPPTQSFFTTTIAPLWNQFTNLLSGIASWVRNLWPWK